MIATVKQLEKTKFSLRSSGIRNDSELTPQANWSALFRAGLWPDPSVRFPAGKQMSLNNLFSSASEALALTLECTVWNNLSFEQMRCSTSISSHLKSCSNRVFQAIRSAGETAALI